MELFNDYKNRYYRCIQNIINQIYNGEKYDKKRYNSKGMHGNGAWFYCMSEATQDQYEL